MAVNDQLKDTSLELTGEIKAPATQSCPHNDTKAVNSRTLPMGGLQVYYLCFDCKHQWQEIEENVPIETVF